MTVKKMTLAAALSIGMLAAAIPSAMAACPCEQQAVPAPQQQLPVVTGDACPLGPCDTREKVKIISEPAPTGEACPICPQEETGPACPVCPEVKDPCTPCPVVAPCPVEKPACGACAAPSEDKDYIGRQIYSYPSSNYGGSFSYGNDPMAYNFSRNFGTSVARGDIGYNNGYNFGWNSPTGAAAQLPCLSNPCASKAPTFGVGVDRYGSCYPNSNATGQALPILGSAMPFGHETGQACGTCGNIDNNACPMTIQTNTSRDAIKKTLSQVEIQTGAAEPLSSMFQDVPTDFWATADINKLVSSNVIAGYPDRTFKPNLPVSRAEFASLVVKGLNLQSSKSYNEQMFCDVSKDHWANNSIGKGVSSGMIAGYPNNLFKPDNPVSRAEALTILAKSITCDITDCEADKILSQYCDAAQVPAWAKLSVAKALKSGVLKQTPAPNRIMPCQDASRAEIASMLSQLRIALGIDPAPVACAPTGKAAMIQNETVVTIPTLKIKMRDEISARSANVGDKFGASTLDSVTINGVTYPCDSKIKGQIVEVIRPTGKDQGALKIALNEISNGTQKALLPNQILTAQVEKIKQPNWFARTIEAPFVWTGSILGNVGRTTGSMIATTGNGIEHVVNGVGVAGGEVFQGQWRGAGRSIIDSTKALVITPVDVTREAINGTAGLFMQTSDSIAYLVDPKGFKVSSIHPNEKVSVAFGCQ